MSEDSFSLTKKQMIDEIIIPNIPSQYLREFRLNSNENDSLRKISRKLSDIIPENDESNRRNKGKKGNRNNPRDTPTPRNGRENQTQRDSSKKTFKNECGIHKNHEWADCRMNPANFGDNKNGNERGRSRRQEHRHNRRRQTSNSPAKSHSPSRRNNTRWGRHHSSRRQENNRIRLHRRKSNDCQGNNACVSRFFETLRHSHRLQRLPTRKCPLLGRQANYVL